jgi:hypothetical protein
MINDMHAAEGSEPAACSGQRVHHRAVGTGRAARIEMDAAEGFGPAASCGRLHHAVQSNAPGDSPIAGRPLSSPSGSGVTPAAVASLNLAPAVSDGRRGLFQRGKPWAPDLPRLKALIAEGKTYAECAEILGRTQSAIENVVDRRKLGKLKKWTSEEMRVLLDRRLQAHPIPDIAASLGRTPQSVEYKWGLLARRLPASVVARVREQVRHNVGRKPRA